MAAEDWMVVQRNDKFGALNILLGRVGIQNVMNMEC